MNPNCHTLVVKYDRCPVPAEASLRRFIAEKLKSTKSEVDYFGCELDSAWDYVDENMKTNLIHACFMTFQFEDADAPRYGTDKREILRYMSNFFDENDSRIIVDDRRKDVDIYFD